MPETELHGTGGEIKTVKGKAKYIAVAAALAALVVATSIFIFTQYGVENPAAFFSGYADATLFKHTAAKIQVSPEIVYLASPNADAKTVESILKKDGWTVQSGPAGLTAVSNGKTYQSYRIIVQKYRLFQLWRMKSDIDPQSGAIKCR